MLLPEALMGASSALKRHSGMLELPEDDGEFASRLILPIC